ncbi:MAG: class I SAM-dependent methyltransferase [Candidatus Sigynarchaeota archaeon]
MSPSIFAWRHHARYYDIVSQAELPYAPTPAAAIRAGFSVLEMGFGLTRGSGQTFIDLGAGTGEVVMYCARTFGIASFGIEINDAMVRIAKKAIRREKLKNAYVWKGDLFDHDLGYYDFIFIFTLPNVQRFLNHVFLTARYGATIFSYKYPLDQLDSVLSLRHEESVEIDGSKHSLFFYERK